MNAEKATAGQTVIEASVFVVVFVLALALALRGLILALRQNGEWFAAWDRYPFP